MKFRREGVESRNRCDFDLTLRSVISSGDAFFAALQIAKQGNPVEVDSAVV